MPSTSLVCSIKVGPYLRKKKWLYRKFSEFV